jgi:hypothetical protein
MLKNLTRCCEYVYHQCFFLIIMLAIYFFILLLFLRFSMIQRYPLQDEVPMLENIF